MGIVYMCDNSCTILKSAAFSQLNFGGKKLWTKYEESVVDKFKSNLLLMIFWLNIINYNS